jgi:HAD superfamily hydrolase (TIGR01490 family)
MRDQTAMPLGGPARSRSKQVMGEGQDGSLEAPAREPRVMVLLDLDRTITRRDTYIPFLMGFLRAHPGRLWRVAPLPFAVVLFALGRRDNAWIKARFLAAVLGGVERAEIDPWAERFVERVLERGLRRRARAVIERHRAAGHELALATASLDLYVGRLGERLGFDRVICSAAEWRPDGTLSGRLDGPNCRGEAKLAAFRSAIGAARDRLHLIAYSDHHDDLPILTEADRAVAVNPTRRLRRAARSANLEVQDWDLETL